VRHIKGEIVVIKKEKVEVSGVDSYLNLEVITKIKTTRMIGILVFRIGRDPGMGIGFRSRMAHAQCLLAT